MFIDIFTPVIYMCKTDVI